MAFSDRGSLLQAPPNLYKVLLAFSQPLVAYVKVGFGGSLISTPPVLVRSGPWSSVSGLPADKISEIDQPAGFWFGYSFLLKRSQLSARVTFF
ncbi:hypothetical protein L6164_037798 [Bauhinia variegata]|uniref:Uncharacterized protein n=1 Tax=Bauhinia variegata TaxID=167791 RepID=A0ACB9KLM4_BAUVA|nr:hypothetical protein L6164_037798 [Bauhinia variegata]